MASELEVRTRIARDLQLLKHEWNQAYDEPGGALCAHCGTNYPGKKLKCPGISIPTIRALQRRVDLELKLIYGSLRVMGRYKKQLNEVQP